MSETNENVVNSQGNAAGAKGAAVCDAGTGDAHGQPSGEDMSTVDRARLLLSQDESIARKINGGAVL